MKECQRITSYFRPRLTLALRRRTSTRAMGMAGERPRCPNTRAGGLSRFVNISRWDTCLGQKASKRVQTDCPRNYLKEMESIFFWTRAQRSPSPFDLEHHKPT